MNPEIGQRRRLHLTGLTLEGAAMSPYILQLWIKLSGKIMAVSGKVNPEVLYGVWRKGSENGDQRLTYMVGVETHPGGPVPGEMEAWDIHPALCAVFSPRGDIGKIVGSYQEIEGWFEGSSRGSAASGYVVEIYDTRQALDDRYLVEI